MASDLIATPVPAATVMLLRDGDDGMEVFMIVRRHSIDFASGALVFPGGKVEASDADPTWAEFAPLDAAPAERANIVAAARETFEEAGLVLARKRGAQGIIDPSEAYRLTERHRPAILAGDASFRDLIAGEGLALATELMVPFAHWITPEGMPKRFDTFFYLVAAPVEQLALHDGVEAVDGLWIAPQRALREADAGTLPIVFPTKMNLQKLARYRTVAETVAASRSHPPVTVMPRIEQTETTHTLHIPEAAGYGVTSVTINGPLRP